jgi:hypothetical protein
VGARGTVFANGRGVRLILAVAAALCAVVLVACSSAPQDGVDDGSTDLAGQTCSHGYYTKPAADGVYYATDFGCSIAPNGTKFKDPGDNCIPGCLSTAQQSICAGLSGPDCEDKVTWYTADAARFGCMSRVQVKNPSNGKSAVLLVLDYGPGCRVEDNVNHPVLDMSYRAIMYLFGEEHGAVDRAKVDVVPVPASTPLGPTTASPPSADAGTNTDSGAPPPAPDASSAGNGCPVLAYPSGIHIQTYEDSATTDSYANHLASGQTAPKCFIDTDHLDDPVAGMTYDLTVHVATHFQLEELVGTEVAQGYGHFVLADPTAVADLETFRDDVAEAVTINSGFRSPKHQEATCNSLCGNPLGCPGTCANNSRHMWGDAFDLPLAFYTKTDEDLACSAGFKFAYLESGTHLHIDRNPAYATCVEE